MDAKFKSGPVVYELARRRRGWEPVNVHVFELGPSRILFDLVEVEYTVRLDRRWQEPQPVQRCQECAELIALAAKPMTS